MKVVIDINDRDYELLKNAGITIDFNTLFHGKEKDRELTFSIFNLIESLKNGIPYNSAGDLISRSALKKSIKSYADDQYAENEYLGECAIMAIINDAPAVEYTFEEAFQKTVCDNKLYCPNKRPEGEWIIDGHHIRCNRCNEYICNTDREGNNIPDNFCPNCGADMRKGSTESLDYQRVVEDAEYCERHEPTYNSDDGSM